MAHRAEYLKNERIDHVAAMVRERLEPDRAEAAERFTRLYCAAMPPDDIIGSDPESLYGAAVGLFAFARERKAGAPKLRVYNPRLDDHGWVSDHTVVEILNDDMPFLVDSVTAALNRQDLAVQILVHPVMRLRRDERGRLLDVATGDQAAGDVPAESVMHIEVNQQAPQAHAAIAAGLEAVLTDVRRAVQDWRAMLDKLAETERAMEATPAGPPPDEAAEARDFLRWLHDNHFTLLGYRDFSFTEEQVRTDEGSALGILRDPDARVFDDMRNLSSMPAEVMAFLRQPNLLLITKAGRPATVHRSVLMDVIGVKRFDKKGRVVGMHAFIGLFTSAAYTRSPTQIPVLRRKVERAIARAGFPPASHDGKALMNILETFPRDELFQLSGDGLFATVMGILNLQERSRVALFVRVDEFERFVSCLVFVPRDRYDTTLRRKAQGILEEAFAGQLSAFYTQVGDAPLARLHFIIKTPAGGVSAFDAREIEGRLAQAARSWTDHFQDALIQAHGEERGLRLSRRYVQAFPASYTESHGVQTAVADVDRIEALTAAGGGIGLNLYRPVEAAECEARFKLYHLSDTVPLSDVLPMLEHMGLKVISELPHPVHPANAAPVWIHDFSMVSADGEPIAIAESRDAFHDAFLGVWRGEAEDDGFNRLVLRAGLSWREVMVLRAYAKYLRQAGFTFSQTYMEQSLAANPQVAALVAALFRALFDPQQTDGAEARSVEAALAAALDLIANADDDRIIRRFVNLVQATLRTNYFQQADGQPKSYVSFKLDSRAVEELPLPRPMVEVFVYSPRVEAVHLRGGKVARGGIRWSDRKEDFRTEILGLMKAQMVKNAVIVPVGSKGGFVVKRPPPASAGREAALEEGIACYRTLMRGLLDITDNLKAGKVLPPPQVVRRDGDDPYLVVAADKGTATFSDIANAVSQDYGFWLDDAFASGGSQGYDHKAMGITARGAWISVQRHFREMGIDVQEQDFTCVGVGDMSGDVFGNGMLRSAHTRLVAAFNHAHIFLDPNPDPAAAFAERRRLFTLPRSQWSDYDPSVISKGGGVFSRQAKTIALTPEVRALLGLDGEHATPSELIRAMLTAPVDLLWFGGIGTYVKGVHQSHADAGDRANDSVRVDGRAVRARVIGEGANLALTQSARIEYALAGGRLNTDAIDNSAGVDTSDHEVNIKILLNEAVANGDLTVKQRNQILTSMTDEVAALVLRDNYLQTQAVSMMEAQSADLIDHQARLMRLLEKEGRLNRAIEFLPDDDTLAERAAARRGLTRPEIAVVLAYGKIWLYDHILDSDLPDDPMLVEDLERYFPTPLRSRFKADIARHRLRREIIATHTTNSMINRVGGTFISQMMEKTGMPPADIARAYLIARDSFRMREVWQGVEALDNTVAAAVQTAMLIEANRLIERGTAWVLRYGERPLDVGAARAELEPGIAALRDCLGEILPPATAAVVSARAEEFAAAVVPADFAARMGGLIVLASAADIVRIASRRTLPVSEIGRLYFAVGARFGLGWLRQAAERMSGGSHWQKLAVAAVIDELYALQRDLTVRVVETAAAAAPDPAIAQWVAANAQAVDRSDQFVAELRAQGAVDLAMLTVATRQFRALTEG